MIETDDTSDDGLEAGIFTWCLSDGVIYADSAVAALFGLDPVLTVNGLPPLDYLERVYVEDRARVARLWSQAIISGAPYRAEYRVSNADGQSCHVMAYGRCFRDKTGAPAHYAGIVHPIVAPALPIHLAV